MTKTVTFVGVGETSGVAYKEVRDSLETIPGVVVTKWVSDQVIGMTNGGLYVWNIEVKVEVSQ